MNLPSGLLKRVLVQVMFLLGLLLVAACGSQKPQHGTGEHVGGGKELSGLENARTGPPIIFKMQVCPSVTRIDSLIRDRSVLLTEAVEPGGDSGGLNLECTYLDPKGQRTNADGPYYLGRSVRIFDELKPDISTAYSDSRRDLFQPFVKLNATGVRTPGYDSGGGSFEVWVENSKIKSLFKGKDPTKQTSGASCRLWIQGEPGNTVYSVLVASTERADHAYASCMHAESVAKLLNQ